MVEQLRGQSFLNAYNNLRGGGSITGPEGEKATQAQIRLNTAVTQEDFAIALKDARDLIAERIAKAGGQIPEFKSTAQGEQQLIAPPKAGDISDGYRFKGGDFNDINNWEQVQ